VSPFFNSLFLRTRLAGLLKFPSAAMLPPTVLAAQKMFQGRTGHALVHMKKGHVPATSFRAAV
jgi:hypothetical protein